MVTATKLFCPNRQDAPSWWQKQSRPGIRSIVEQVIGQSEEDSYLKLSRRGFRFRDHFNHEKLPAPHAQDLRRKRASRCDIGPQNDVRQLSGRVEE